MACDICGKNDAPLVDLLDQYKTSDIKQICPDCEAIVNRKNGRLMILVAGIKSHLLNRFMSELKAKAEGKK